MAKPTLRYDKMVETALRGVVQQALALAAEHGLPPGHHFYITFRTGFPGVVMPEFLRTEYPDEMTVVLEHQFWGLEVDDMKFEVTLSFRSQGERLTIPLAAISAFADPSVKFGLEFPAQPTDPSAVAPAKAKPRAAGPKMVAAATDEKQPSADRPDEAAGDGAAAKPGEVVRLDTFRKK
ncbi:MAG TPA: ClpXP protease specificity-enhancing factor SspB [Stellaceae bacterium]|nr:ClpXP protease specificity-enhancing factor SspB [Stellaceae bacterium]